MVEVPIWAAVLVLFLIFPAFGLWAYWFGWNLRGKSSPRVTYRETKFLSPEQRRAFDASFEHMDKAFDEMRKVFK